MTLWAAVNQVKRSAVETGVSFKEYGEIYTSITIIKIVYMYISPVFRGRDPSAVAVLLEDSAAVIGVMVASAALSLTHWTGNTLYDAIGSITIGGVRHCRLTVIH